MEALPQSAIVMGDAIPVLIDKVITFTLVQ